MPFVELDDLTTLTPTKKFLNNAGLVSDRETNSTRMSLAHFYSPAIQSPSSQAVGFDSVRFDSEWEGTGERFNAVKDRWLEGVHHQSVAVSAAHKNDERSKRPVNTGIPAIAIIRRWCTTTRRRASGRGRRSFWTSTMSRHRGGEG
jgi:hypothetical protein